MENSRKKGNQDRTPPSKRIDQTPKVLSLRLPGPLRVAADKYADSTGVSLNGLVCIALADYLTARGHKVKQ